MNLTTSGRTTSTVGGIPVVAAVPGRGTFVDMIVNALSGNNVAAAIGPDAVAAVLPLLQRVFSATLAAIVDTIPGDKINRRRLAGIDIRDGDWVRWFHCNGCCKRSKEEEGGEAHVGCGWSGFI